MSPLKKTELAFTLIDRLIEVGFQIADRVRARRAARAAKKKS